MIDKSTRILMIDEKYRTVLGVMQLTKSDNEFITPITLHGISPLTKSEVLQYNFDEHIEKFLNHPFYIKGLKSPSSYIFTEDLEFKVKPRILTYLSNGNPNRLSLKTQYTCCVQYFDPENVNFREHIKFIKFKDRYGFLNIRKELILDNEDKAYVKFKSDFPGVCKFRSKDSAYICAMSVLECRFIQEVIEDEI